MTKLTIKIDENISLTGTIMSEEESIDDYEFYYYQPDCPWGANCEYAGNVLLPMESNITSNVAPKVPMPPFGPRPRTAVPGWYNMNKNLSLVGNLAVTGDASVYGNITVNSGAFKGVGSLSSLVEIASTPTSPSWTGRVGEIAISGTFVYLCVATDSWIRWPIEKTW